MAYNKILLHNIVLLSIPVTVSLPNSFEVTVNYMGSLFLTSDLEIHYVSFVSIYKQNLLLVCQLCT